MKSEIKMETHITAIKATAFLILSRCDRTPNSFTQFEIDETRKDLHILQQTLDELQDLIGKEE